MMFIILQTSPKQTCHLYIEQQCKALSLSTNPNILHLISVLQQSLSISLTFQKEGVSERENPYRTRSIAISRASIQVEYETENRIPVLYG